MAYALIVDKEEYNIGETAIISFPSAKGNVNPNQVDILQARVSDTVNREFIVIDVVETGTDTGKFTASITFSLEDSDENAGILRVDNSNHAVSIQIIEPNFQNILAVQQISILQKFTVKCTHSPIWPQPGEEVTIEAISTDFSGSLVRVDTVEIWVNVLSPVSRDFDASSDSYSESFTDDLFIYGCRVEKDGAAVFSGWKVVSVGLPVGEWAIPVHFTGSRANSIDFVFLPDEDSYTNYSDPDFLNDVSVAIDTFWTERIYINNQDKINFWIARDSGIGRGVQTNGTCILEAPNIWEFDDYSFANSGIILHPDILQDCANQHRRIFSSEPDSRTLFHEAGHSPFGLADERPNAPHFQKEPFPNLYETRAGCENDPFNWDKPCREFISTWNNSIPDDFGEDWFTSDPDSLDLMINNDDFRPLDIRRTNWMFDNCDIGEC